MRLSSEPDRIVDQLGGARVLCIGDAMLDHFVYGLVDRQSLPSLMRSFKKAIGVTSD